MMRLSALLRDGDQLELDLFRGIPWAGVSPRVLTRRFIPLFLRQKPPCHEVFFDPEQLELFPRDQATQRKGPPRNAGGAPLLVDLKRTRRGRVMKDLTWRDENG